MAHVIPFPSPQPEACWFSAGSLHARYGAHVRHIEPAEAERFREFWKDVATRLGHLPTDPDARHAARRWMEFTSALDRLADYNRVVGKRDSSRDHAPTNPALRVQVAQSPDLRGDL